MSLQVVRGRVGRVHCVVRRRRAGAHGVLRAGSSGGHARARRVLVLSWNATGSDSVVRQWSRVSVMAGWRVEQSLLQSSSPSTFLRQFFKFFIFVKQCSKICGPGQQFRLVTCMTSSNPDVAVELDESRCEWEVRPASARACEAMPCSGAEWVTSEWTGVSC